MKGYGCLCRTKELGETEKAGICPLLFLGRMFSLLEADNCFNYITIELATVTDVS